MSEVPRESRLVDREELHRDRGSCGHLQRVRGHVTLTEARGQVGFRSGANWTHKDPEAWFQPPAEALGRHLRPRYSSHLYTGMFAKIISQTVAWTCTSEGVYLHPPTL